MIMIVVVVAVIGFLMWLFHNYATMIDGRFKMIIEVVVLICTVFWVLAQFGLFGGGVDIPVPQIR